VYGAKFRVFAISAALLHLGINIAVPAYSIYHVRCLNLSNSVIGMFSLAAGLTTVLAYPLWGRVSRRAGHSLVYVLSILAYAPFPALYGLHGSVTYLLALQAAIGFFNAGFALTILNLMLQHVNPDDSANGIAVFNLLINATGVLGPPLAALVVSRYGVTWAFVLSSIVRAAGCIVYIGASGMGDTFGKLHKTFSPWASRRRRLNRKEKGVL
jgi:MFS family permease